jgi:hypothetical protein
MKWLRSFLLFAGIALLLLNTIGLFKSLRNEDLYKEVTPYKNDISIRLSDAEKQLNRMQNETEKDFAVRMTLLINHAMAHYWKDEGIKKYHLQIPLWENYILSITHRISGDKKYEFRNYRKVIERGAGICSQPCIALKYLLNDNEIKADLWDLWGHVVVEAEFSDRTKYTLDPDYGNHVPYGIEYIQTNLDIIREYYKNQDYIYADHYKDHRHTEDIVNIYEKDRNHVYYMNRTFEDFSYIVIWILPLLLILPFTIAFFKKNKSLQHKN